MGYREIAHLILFNDKQAFYKKYAEFIIFHVANTAFQRI